MHFAVEFLYPGMKKKEKSPPVTKDLIKEMQKHALVHLTDLHIVGGVRLAEKFQSIANSDAQLREFWVSIGMNNQSIDFNMESPEADSKKGIKRNSALFLWNNTNLEIEVREKHFRLEKDEETFIKQIRDKMNSQN